MTNPDRTASSLVLLLACIVFVIGGVFAIASAGGGITIKNPHLSDYQRGWDAAAAAYRSDYARGVTDGQHKALSSQCIGSMEPPSE